MLLYETHENDYQLVRLRDTFSFYSHIHRQIELCYCRRGSLVATCRGERYELGADSWLIVPPETEHSYLSGEKLDGFILLANLTSSPLLANRFRQRLLTPVVRDPSGEAARYLGELVASRKRRHDDAVVQGFLHLILGFLLERCAFEQSSEGSRAELCYGVVTYLAERFREPVTLAAVAKRFGVNASYLSRMFSERIGCGFCSVLYGYRMDYAKFLLTQTEAPVTEVCFESGFPTIRTFHRWFRQLEGCTPLAYRRSRAGSGAP